MTTVTIDDPVTGTTPDPGDGQVPQTHVEGPGTSIETLRGMSVAEIAETIGVPVTRWAGNCYGIALAMVQHGLAPAGSRAVYGHWTGPIAETSMFAGRRALGFTGHGWIVTGEDQILDPTRFAFEDADPYLYIGADLEDSCEVQCRTCLHVIDEHDDGIGRCVGGDMAGYDCGMCLFEPNVDPRAAAEEDEYDEGGNRLRAATLRPLPTGPDGRDPLPDTLPADVAVLMRTLGHPGGPLSVAQAMWLACLPLGHLGGAAADAYTWLGENDLTAFIPIDNRLAVLGR